MRPEPNNDIDLLLRQLSRRNGVPVSEIDEQHLDADELNSYVANALPAAARARYTAHLADCSSCRKMVVELSSAQGAVPVKERATVVALAPWGLKSFLASLFSPMVLRYAVPALGLILIGVVALVVTNQRRSAPESPSVAQLNERDQNTSAQPYRSEAEGYAQPQPSAADEGRTRSDGPARQDVAPAEKDGPTTKDDSVAKPVAPVIANKPGDTTGTAAAAEPPPAPKAAVEDESARATDLEKQKKAERPAKQPETVATTQSADTGKGEYQKAPQVGSVTVAPGGVARKDIEIQGSKLGEADAARERQDFKREPATGNVRSREETKARAQTRDREEGRDREELKDKDSSSETRSVAGRRFRKSGRFWIDTAYDSSKPITTVVRGSEQYRGLVGDEPSIRTIADQLDGEIIVVWKGRTYRIR